MKNTFYVAVLFITGLLHAQIERVEPPFWWEDMKESKLQLLIYGKNISQYQPEMSGVNIVEVTRTENPNYLFVTIDTEGLTAGMYDFNLNKGKKVATYSYELNSVFLNLLYVKVLIVQMLFICLCLIVLPMEM